MINKDKLAVANNLILKHKDKKDKTKKQKTTGFGSAHCGYCCKEHNRSDPPCDKFIALIETLNKRAAETENQPEPKEQKTKKPKKVKT